MQVKLKTPPWTRRWEVASVRGIEDTWTQATPWFKRKLHKTIVNDYEKYDLIADYRTSSTKEQEVFVQKQMQKFVFFGNLKN